MSGARALRAVCAAVIVSAALTGCGGGGAGDPRPPSTLDPASMAPAGSVAYVSAVIRPQGSLRANLVEAIDSLAGRGSAERLGARIEQSLGHGKWSSFSRWIGERVGLAMTGLPAQIAGGGAAIDRYLVVIAPTGEPAAARHWLTENRPGSGAIWKVVGHYVLIGGAAAVAQAASTTARTSLAASPRYRSALARLGSDELFTAYAPLHELLAALMPLAKAMPRLPALSLTDAERRAPPGSSAAFGVSALHNEFRIDLVSQGVPETHTPVSGVASDVSSLPGGSWLALTLGRALAKTGTVGRLAAGLPKLLARIGAAGGVAGRVPSAPLRFIEQDLVPALGPAELSVSGTSGSTLQAGLLMAPANKAAGARLVAAIKQLVGGLPISASTVGGRVAVTFGFSNLAQLLNPSVRLADNPAFKRALAQLPAGAKADLYLNFAGISALTSLDHNASDQSVIGVLGRLDYLIAGGTDAHYRLVLATR